MIRAGTLKTRVEVQKPTYERSSSGAKRVSSWTVVVVRHVEIAEQKIARGQEFFHGDYQEKGINTYQIKMRYENCLKDMRPDWRLVVCSSGQVYEVQAIENWLQNNTEFRIRVTMEWADVA